MNLRKLKRTKKKASANTAPHNAEKYYTLAREHKNHGQLDQAITFFKKALRHNPKHVDALNSLGNTLHSLNRLAEAVDCYRTVCQLVPDSPQAHYNLGTTLFESDEHAASVNALKQAINLAPDYPEAHASLGVAYQAIGDLHSAKLSLEQAIKLDPHSTKNHRFLGLILKDLGDTKTAVAKFSKILHTHPEDAFSRYLLSRYTKYTSAHEAEIPRILDQLNSVATSNDDAILLHFTLGKIYDDLRLYTDAFHHYRLANSKKRATFAKASITPGIDIPTIKQTFTSTLYARFAHHGNHSKQPVFIIGMPRSGTTLVEQICASHSLVHGAGELMEINKIVESLKSGKTKKDQSYPLSLATLPPGHITSLADKYLKNVSSSISPDIHRITDKMPTNFIELGLIRILFPKARIIHCLRNAQDTCLSNFFQNFEKGNECSFNLDELTFYYRKYRELMTFWQKTLPGEIHEVQYEELVANSNEVSRNLIDFLGLNWEDNCLSFFKTKRMVHTSSDWQVQQPIYQGSVQRWKNYADELNKVSSWRMLEKTYGP